MNSESRRMITGSSLLVQRASHAAGALGDEVDSAEVAR